MKIRFALALVFLTLSFPVAAIDMVTFTRQIVNAGEEIELHIPNACTNSPAPVVARSGFDITIRLPRPQACTPGTRVMQLGPLPPGEYSVGVYDSGNTPWGFGAFRVVSEGEQPFAVHPFAVPQFAAGVVELHISMPDLAFNLCPQLACTVRIGNVEATQKREGPHPGELIVTAPANVPGLHPVSISHGTSTVTLPNAVYYYGDLDFTFFERILFPLNFDAPGAHGSLWRTETAIANPQPWPILTYNSIAPIDCAGITFPCTELLGPRSKLSWSGGRYPHGATLLVARRDAEDLAFSLRVRDISRVGEGFGTEIPVVRERDMFTGTMTLLDVPLDSRYRVKLRIYAYGVSNGARGTLNFGDGPYQVTSECVDATECARTAAYAEIDLPVGAPGAREIIYIEPPAGTLLAWAFASVTNNDTQQVTIVTPDGIGGEPE